MFSVRRWGSVDIALALVFSVWRDFNRLYNELAHALVTVPVQVLRPVVSTSELRQDDPKT